MTLIARIDNQIGGGLNWPSDLRLQRDLVNNHGEVLVHEAALACPRCRTGDIDDLYGKIGSCDLCYSGGFLYRNPRLIMGIISGISGSRSLQDFGWATPGDCIMGLSPFEKPGVHDFDKITFQNPMAMDDGEVIVRGEWHERFPAVYAENEDRLSYEAKQLLLCLDEDGNEYYASDVTLESKKIIWSGNKPEIKKRYTIKYAALIEWIAFNPEFKRFSAGEDIGSRLLLRRRHIAFLKHDTEHQPPALQKSQLAFNTKVEV